MARDPFQYTKLFRAWANLALNTFFNPQLFGHFKLVNSLSTKNNKIFQLKEMSQNPKITYL